MAERAVEPVPNGLIKTIADNLGRVVHAPDETLRLDRPLPRRGGARDHRGLPGRRQDDARQGARPLARLPLLPPPVHARPTAVGRDRRQRLQPAAERVRVPARPRVREPPPGGRGEPRFAEDPGGAARVHGGAAGVGRRGHVPARAAVHGHGDAEPDRVRRDVSAAGGAARPLHDAGLARLPAARRGGADARRADQRAAARLARARSPTPRTCSGWWKRRVACIVEESLGRYVVAILRQTRSDQRLYLGASPRAGIALHARGEGAGALRRIATTSLPTT